VGPGTYRNEGLSPTAMGGAGLYTSPCPCLVRKTNVNTCVSNCHSCLIAWLHGNVSEGLSPTAMGGAGLYIPTHASDFAYLCASDPPFTCFCPDTFLHTSALSSQSEYACTLRPFICRFVLPKRKQSLHARRLSIPYSPLPRPCRLQSRRHSEHAAKTILQHHCWALSREGVCDH
jgi:hypothetical protein